MSDKEITLFRFSVRSLKSNGSALNANGFKEMGGARLSNYLGRMENNRAA